MLKFYFCFVFMFFIPKLFWLYLENLIIFMIIFSILILPNSFMYSSMMQKIDLMSYSLILITLFIFILMILSSTILYMKNNNKTSFLIVLLFLMFILVGCFGILDFLMFYILFEMSLVPTLLLILGWGYQPERIIAGMYMLMYTLIASFPLLLLIFFCQVNKVSLLMNLLFWFNSPWWVQVILILAFLVKMPMFMVHLWLPKAHVEAPIAGSMILAGVLLKLGGYGILRVLPMIFQMKLNLLILLSICNLFGSMMISMKCLSQTDFKSLIAYSSVVHMGFILFCVFNCNNWGWSGSLLMMVAHGICSSGLFTLANVIYERYSSRSMIILKGMINLMPSMSLWWFLLLSSNMSAPPTLNLMSEISLLISVMNWSNLSMIILIFTCFFSAGYCLYLFSFSQHGLLTSSFFCQVNNNLREYFLMFLHWIPINIMILKSEILFSWI